MDPTLPPVQGNPNQPVANTPLPSESNITVTSSGPSRSFNRVRLILIIILIIVGITILGLLFLKPKSNVTSIPTNQIQIQKPTSEASSPHYIGTDTASFKDIESGASTGEITRDIEKGIVTRSISISLPTPPEGSFYQAWAVKDSENKFPLGNLVETSPGVYTLDTINQFDISSFPNLEFEDFYSTTKVTLENQDDDIIEKEIFKATFTK